MAGKKRKKVAKMMTVKSESCSCGSCELDKIEAGLLLLIGLIWALQVFKVFTFGGEYFQIIGSILVLVIGVTKFVSAGKRC